MEKPHYKQPITADNIETALQFYLEKTSDIKYKRNEAVDKKVFERINKDLNDNCPEFKSMHDLEQLLEESVPLVPKLHFMNSSNKKFIPLRTDILHTILTATYPHYSSTRYGNWSGDLIKHFKALYKTNIVNSKK